MPLLSAEQLAAYLEIEDATNIFDRYFQIAYALANDSLCNAITAYDDATNVSAIVENGTTVVFPRWFTDVSSIFGPTGVELSYNVEYEVGDVDPATGLTAPSYTNHATLTTPLPDGTVVTVKGSSGFQDMPGTLRNLICSIIKALHDRDTGADAETSKSIEDVSASRTDNRSMNTPLANALQTNQAILSKWSLCRYGNLLQGVLGYPRPMFHPPYWANTADYMAR